MQPYPACILVCVASLQVFRPIFYLSTSLSSICGAFLFSIKVDYKVNMCVLDFITLRMQYFPNVTVLIYSLTLFKVIKFYLGS